MSKGHIYKEALIEQLEQNRTNAIKFLWRLGAGNSTLNALVRNEMTNKVSMLEQAIDELKNCNKEPAEVTRYFEKLVQEELSFLNNFLEKSKAEAEEFQKFITKKQKRIAQ